MAPESFDEQVDRLVELGYPALLDLPVEAFHESVQPLRDRVQSAASSRAANLAFVLVAPLPAERALPLARPSRGEPFVDLHPKTSADFRPLPELGAPDGSPYLLLDVDTGPDLLGVTPELALERIRSRGRSPLTIEEGAAILVQLPDILEERNAFSLLGSRGGDQRVPALWTSRAAGRRGPRLGWCWDRNPHTWLGSASCAGRVFVHGADGT